MLIMVLKGGEDPLCFVCLLVLSWHRNYSFSYIASLSLWSVLFSLGLG